MATNNIDCTAIVTPDAGNNMLPNFSFFSKLVRCDHDESQTLAVREVNLNMEEPCLQLCD